MIEDYSVSNNATKLDLIAQLSIQTRCRKYQLTTIRKNGKVYCYERSMGIVTFRGTVSDEKIYGLTDLKPQANITLTHLAQDVSEVTRGKLILKTAAPYSMLRVYIGGNSLNFSGNAYDIDYYYPDYNFLRISTYSLPRITQYGLFSNISKARNKTTGGVITTLDFTLTYPETITLLNSRKCKVVLEDLFQKEYIVDNLCQTDWKQTVINASTDSLLYSDGQQINLSAILTYNGTLLPNKQIIVHYANTQYNKTTNQQGKTDFEITAEYPYNKIDVEFLGDNQYLGCSKTLLISTSNSRMKTLLTFILPALLVFLITAYGAYKMLKFTGW